MPDELPTNWRWITTGSIVKDLKSGLSRKLSQSDIGLPVLRSTNITEKGIDISDIKYWYQNDPQGADTRNYYLEQGDILINFINSIAQIGKTAIYSNELSRDAIYTTNILRLKTNERIIPKFFLAITKTTEFERFIQSITKPAVNQASFTTVDFRKFRFPLPPLPEQYKIAEILSTWDEAIANTEQLIKALRQRKKGLMQRLLTGQFRFPGFDGEWKKTKIKEMGIVVNGGTPSTFESSFWKGEIFWATPTDITKLPSKYIDFTENKITYKGLKNSSANLLPLGSLLVCSRATIGALAINKVPIATNQGFKNLIPNENFDVNFLYHLLSYNKHILIRYANGSTFLELPKKDFEEISLYTPNLSEQRKISEILNLSDIEIEKYEILITRLKYQKKGLMQRLLTGQVRVKVE